MSNEADARIIIDRLLREADWDIEDKAQVSTEEAATDGRADYVLKDSRSRPLAVIEAKRFSIDPYAAKDQARAYARSLPVHFVILSNGNDHYFWDYASGDARPILGLSTQADLERRANLKQQRQGDLGREHRSLFETIEVNGEPIEYGALRWSRFSTDPDNDRMLRTVRDLLPRFAEHPQLSQGARQIFVGAALVIPGGASLRRMVDLISPVSFMAEDADVLCLALPPVFLLPLSYFLFKERFGWQTVAGTFVAMLGVALLFLV